MEIAFLPGAVQKKNRNNTIDGMNDLLLFYFFNSSGRIKLKYSLKNNNIKRKTNKKAYDVVHDK